MNPAKKSPMIIANRCQIVDLATSAGRGVICYFQLNVTAKLLILLRLATLLRALGARRWARRSAGNGHACRLSHNANSRRFTRQFTQSPKPQWCLPRTPSRRTGVQPKSS